MYYDTYCNYLCLQMTPPPPHPVVFMTFNLEIISLTNQIPYTNHLANYIKWLHVMWEHNLSPAYLINTYLHVCCNLIFFKVSLHSYTIIKDQITTDNTTYPFYPGPILLNQPCQVFPMGIRNWNWEIFCRNPGLYRWSVD